ncbi:MAG: peroxiredoxin-like family protein [bacterium]
MKKILRHSRWAFAFVAFLFCAHAGAEVENLFDRVARSPQEIRPLLLGEPVPDVILKTIDGKPFHLSAALRKKPTVLIFYRGGWCAYCTAQLGQLQTIEDKLLAMGYQIIAISPDRPEKLKESAEQSKLHYRLLSDSNAEAMTAMGIAYRVDEATVRRWKEEDKIDLEADSGERHHILPVPAAFVVDRFGRINFSYVNPDYKVRVNTDLLLDAAKAAVRQ